MYCRNCGSLLNDKADICIKCGCRPLNGTEFCQECGAKTNEKQEDSYHRSRRNRCCALCCGNRAFAHKGRRRQAE